MNDSDHHFDHWCGSIEPCDDLRDVFHFGRRRPNDNGVGTFVGFGSDGVGAAGAAFGLRLEQGFQFFSGHGGFREAQREDLHLTGDVRGFVEQHGEVLHHVVIIARCADHQAVGSLGGLHHHGCASGVGTTFSAGIKEFLHTRRRLDRGSVLQRVDLNGGGLRTAWNIEPGKQRCYAFQGVPRTGGDDGVAAGVGQERWRFKGFGGTGHAFEEFLERVAEDVGVGEFEFVEAHVVDERLRLE